MAFRRDSPRGPVADAHAERRHGLGLIPLRARDAGTGLERRSARARCGADRLARSFHPTARTGGNTNSSWFLINIRTYLCF